MAARIPRLTPHGQAAPTPIPGLTDFHRSILQNLGKTNPVDLLNLSMTLRQSDYPTGTFQLDCLQSYAPEICAKVGEDLGIETHPEAVETIMTHVERFNKVYETIEPVGTKLRVSNHALSCLDLVLGLANEHHSAVIRAYILGNEHVTSLITDLAILLKWRWEHGVFIAASI